MTLAALPPELAQVERTAQCLADAATVAAAMDQMAQRISAHLARNNPVLLGVMTGGVVPLAMLLERLAFPLQVDYAHLTRYGAATSGGEIAWLRRPPAELRGRTVLVVDDILDHGLTLAALVDECRQLGAAEVLTCVLVTKDIPHRRGLAAADFSALTVPDAYVFGCGMDYKTWLRNAPGIYAVGDDA